MEPDDKTKSSKKHNVDSGFAWIVLIACFVQHFFVVGSVEAFGVLYTEMVEYYSSGSGNTAWIGVIATTLQFGLGPVANRLCRIYSFRRISLTGGFLIGLGYCLSGFATRMEFMYLTFLCIGTSSNTVWIIGAIFSNVCVAACTFREPKRHLVEKVRADTRTSGDYNNVDNGRSQKRESDENIVGKSKKRRCDVLDLQLLLFRNMSFTLYVISFMCCAFGYTASLIVIPASVKAHGYSKTYVSISVTIFGGVEVVARILIGLLANLNIIKSKYLYAFSMFIGGTFSLIVTLFENFTFIAVHETITAAFSGSYICFMSLLTIDIVGLKKLSPALGLLAFSLSVANLPSQPVVGWLYDLFGNWRSSFILVGSVYTSAGLIILLEPFVVKCCKTADITLRFTEIQQDVRIRSKQTHDKCKDAC